MAKACVLINKITSMGTLKSRWNHDINVTFRQEHVTNADPSQTNQNDILLSCHDENNNEISYDEAVKERIKDLQQADGRKIRSNQVKAYDIVLEFGDADDIEQENIDVSEWERRSLEWLKETFNVAGDEKDNVLSVVCHKDEASPHIHAIVTPVDERGCLCAKSFTNGPAALSKFQDSYAKKLEDLGIERGVKGSSAHHKPNRTYNAEKNKAAELPKPEPNQTAEEYYNMYQEELEQRAIDHKIKLDKLARNMRASIDKERILQKNALSSEMDTMTKYYDIIKKDYTNDLEATKAEIIDLKRELADLYKEHADLSDINKAIIDMEAMATLYSHQQDVFECINKIDPELAERWNEIQTLAETEYKDYLESSQYSEELDDAEYSELE